MADCFWTDMVGCAEDCDRPTPGYFYSYRGDGGNYVTPFPLTFGPTFSFAVGGCPAAPTLLDVSIVDLTVYHRPSADGAGCTWQGTLLATHGEVADTSAENCYPGGTVWKDESFYASSASATAQAKVTYTIPVVGGYPAVSFDTLSALVHLPTGVNGAWKATIRDNATGELYEGSGVETSCF